MEGVFAQVGIRRVQIIACFDGTDLIRRVRAWSRGHHLRSPNNNHTVDCNAYVPLVPRANVTCGCFNKLLLLFIVVASHVPTNRAYDFVDFTGILGGLHSYGSYVQDAFYE